MGVQQVLFPQEPEKGEGAIMGPPDRIPERRKLRDYQAALRDEALALLNSHGSTLIPVATGCGKTVIGAEVARDFVSRGMRALWLVHREELVHQAYRALRDVGSTQREMREFRADGEAQIVVASKDTLRHRLGKYPPDYFGLIITDEAHHVIARSYRRIYDHFQAQGGHRTCHLGLTATPDRSDGIALGVRDERTGANLGGVFASACRPFSIHDGHANGWLVPFSVWRIVLGDVDTSTVKIVAGDLSQSDLSAILTAERPLLAAAQALLERCDDRPTLGFCASVSHAERIAEILNRYRPGCAHVVTGETSRDVRAALFRDFGRTYQYLLNYGVATEGTDLPVVRAVAMLRMTKSRLVWTQCAGRGTRPQPGIDDVPNDPDARKEWIRQSSKPDCLLLDFVGAVGRHSLVGPMDVLGGESSYDVVQIAKQLSESSKVDAYEALKKAAEIADERRRKEEAERERKRLAKEARRAAIKARAEYVARRLDPTQLLKGDGRVDEQDSLGTGITPGQVDEARALKIIFPEGANRRDASYLIAHEKERRSKGLASAATVRFVKQLYPRMTEGVILCLTQREAGMRIAAARKWRHSPR